jgi:outer membrane protein assembly factor BamB
MPRNNAPKFFKFEFIYLALSLILLASCASKEKTYDKEKAVTAFDVIYQLKIDSELKDVAIKIPSQKENKIWYGLNSEQNADVENISFDFIEKKQLKETHEIWSGFNFKFDDRFIFAPIITSDKLFLLDGSGVLEAYELKSKKRIWKKRIFPRNLLHSYQMPKISFFEGKIFAIAGVNKIAAIDQETGNFIWAKNLATIPVSTPIADGGSLYFTTNDNKLYSLKIATGNLQWVHSGVGRPTGIFGAANPVIYKDIIIASYSSGEIYALNKRTGESLWLEDLNLNRATNSDFYLNDIDATPIIKNDVIYSIGNGGLMKAINVKNGSVLWHKEIAGIVDFWLAGDFLYLINNDNKIMAVYKKTGGIKWISQLPNLKKEKKPQTKIIYSGIVMAGNKLLVSSANGEILILSPFDGKIEKTFNVGAKIYHSPIVVNKKLYLHAIGKYVISLFELN